MSRRGAFFDQRALLLHKRGVSPREAEAELRGLWEKTPGGGIADADDDLPPYPWEAVLEAIERAWGVDA